MAEVSTYIQTFAQVGGASLLSGLLAWMSGHQLAKANARKANAEAIKLEIDSRSEASRIETARANFERALNERTERVMNSMEKQVAALTERVDMQNKLLSEASAQIARMELEIKELHSALNIKTQHLHRVLALLPAVKALYDDSGELDMSLIEKTTVQEAIS